MFVISTGFNGQASIRFRHGTGLITKSFDKVLAGIKVGGYFSTAVLLLSIDAEPPGHGFTDDVVAVRNEVSKLLDQGHDTIPDDAKRIPFNDFPESEAAGWLQRLSDKALASSGASSLVWPGAILLAHSCYARMVRRYQFLMWK